MTAFAPWVGPQFKGPREPGSKRRKRKAAKLKRDENRNKQTVRDRDRLCRFPLCPCHRFGLFLEVSHREHKGMGGDPTGERSAPGLMMLLCNYRHKEGRLSVDKETIRWDPLSIDGAKGPVAWFIDLGVLRPAEWARGSWVELAREKAPGEFEAFTDSQLAILHELAQEIIQRFR